MCDEDERPRGLQEAVWWLKPLLPPHVRSPNTSDRALWQLRKAQTQPTAEPGMLFQESCPQWTQTPTGSVQSSPGPCPASLAIGPTSFLLCPEASLRFNSKDARGCLPSKEQLSIEIMCCGLSGSCFDSGSHT